MDFKTKSKRTSEQNVLSFQNIKHSYQCCQHHHKKAKYRNKKNQDKYCYGCAIQLASKGIGIEMISNENESLSLEQIYLKTQNDIRRDMQQYNKMFSQLIEMLTDMQIKDLMSYNKMLEQNDKKFKESKCQFVTFSKQFKDKIIKIQKQIINIIDNHLKSYDSTANQQTSSTKNLSQTSSFTIKEKLISPYSLTVNQNNSLQDTPESIKSKISSNRGNIKQQPIGMFQRIDVCQSLEGCQQFSKKGKNEQSIKSEYRYGRCSIE